MSTDKHDNFNPKQIYNTAHSFFLAANRCNEPRVQDIGFVQMLIVPTVVNAAFSCELSIKAVLNQLGIPVPHGNDGHKIDSLFSCLPIELQEKVKKDVNSANFCSDIQFIYNAFVEWRYLYEKGSASIPFDFLMTLAQALCKEAEIIVTKSTP